MKKNRKLRLLFSILLIVSFFVDSNFGESAIVHSKSTSSKSVSKKKKRKHYRKRRSRRRRKKRRRRYRRSTQTGILVETREGVVITDKLSNVPFNPASAIKVLTAYGAIKKFGPTHRFKTDLLLSGNLDTETGVLDGNVYIRGMDPEFSKSDCVSLVKALNDHGVKKIKGKLLVGKKFSLYCNKNALVSGRGLVKVFKYAIAGKAVTVVGGAHLGDAPHGAIVIYSHQSEMLSYTLKEVLSKSLNSAAERIGDSIGGVKALRLVVSKDLKITDKSIKVTSASGLGHNRITPKQMMIVIKAFDKELSNHGLKLHNLLAIGGISGTLEKRFTGSLEKGSVAAKTGTLSHTDGGVSALVGVTNTKQGELFFVDFSWHGGVYSMRKQQDQMIRKLQQERGGPQSYIPVATSSSESEA